MSPCRGPWRSVRAWTYCSGRYCRSGESRCGHSQDSCKLGYIGHDAAVAQPVRLHRLSITYQFVLDRGSLLLSQAVGVVHVKNGLLAPTSLAKTIVTVVAALRIVAARMDPVTQIYSWLLGIATLGVVLMP